MINDRKLAITDSFIGKDTYFSKEVAALEKERLWPKIWQVACRQEDLPSIGSYVTYEICDESVIIMRTGDDELKAFHNVCKHRGRRLLEDRGNCSKIRCPYHGWTYTLDGRIKEVIERDDWQGCPNMDDDDISLDTVLIDTWGGWVFINLDQDAEPLLNYLKPIPERIDPFEFEKWRYRWHKQVGVKCNWKVALEAFNEFYHVTATHPQLQRFQDDISRCEIHGKHGMMHYPPELNRPWGVPGARTGQSVPADVRPSLVAAAQEFEKTLKAIWSPRAIMATHRVMTELPPDVEHGEALAKMVEYWREAAEAEGAGWPNITPEQMEKAGYDWHVFPNFIFLMGLDAGIFYRVRPNGDDPESCVFDVWSLVRYVPGGEPKIKHEKYEHWRDCDSLGLILEQDFKNMEKVHQGMKSRAFAFARTNPLQETVLANFHRMLKAYLHD